MNRTVPELPDAELAVLQSLWDRGPSTIRQVAGDVYPADAEAQYTTVQKLLDRLEGKGCVRRDRGSWAHVFSAAVGRDDVIGQRLQAMAQKLCGGSLTPIFTNLVRSKSLTAKERREIKRLMEELES